eukprot:1932256-Pyramimonas_sp.AAC.1
MVLRPQEADNEEEEEEEERDGEEEDRYGEQGRKAFVDPEKAAAMTGLPSMNIRGATGRGGAERRARSR